MIRRARNLTADVLSTVGHGLLWLAEIAGPRHEMTARILRGESVE